MSQIFTTIFYQPILNLLVFVYNLVGDMGLTIILLTILIKIVLWPLNQKAIKAQQATQELQPKIEEIKKQYAGNQVEISRATMELYKSSKVNPFSSCLPILIQLPFLWAVYKVLSDGLSNQLSSVYPFISKPEVVNILAFGFLDLAKPNVYLAVMAGLAQFWQARMMIKKKKPDANKQNPSKEEGMTEIMNKQMLYFMPAITVFIGISLPGGLTLYWFVITILTALQQILIIKKLPSKHDVIEGEIIK